MHAEMSSLIKNQQMNSQSNHKLKIIKKSSVKSTAVSNSDAQRKSGAQTVSIDRGSNGGDSSISVNDKSRIGVGSNISRGDYASSVE